MHRNYRSSCTLGRGLQAFGFATNPFGKNRRRFPRHARQGDLL